MDLTPQIANSLVSVIIPTYNRANLLPRAIKSVLNQSYRNFELIIIDDASTDETSQVIEAFPDSHIQYIQLKRNMGKSAALNRGIRVSRGNFITILDDDDEFFPQTLQLEVNALVNTPDDLGFVFGLAKVYRQGKISFYPKKMYSKKADFYKAQLDSTALSLCGTLIKKSCFEKVGFLNEKLVLGEDWEFMFRLLAYYDYKYINSPIYKANYHDLSNISHITLNYKRNYYERIKSYKIFLQANIKEIQKFRPVLAKFYFRIARNLYFLHKFTLSKKFFRGALHIDPKRISALIWLVILEFIDFIPHGSQIIQLMINKLENTHLPLIKQRFNPIIKQINVI